MAIYNYKKIIETDSNRNDVYNTLADKYNGLKRYKDAIYMLSTKVNRGKAKINDRYELAKYYYQTNQYELADSQFAVVNRAVPSNVNVYLWRGRTNAGLDPDSKKGIAKPFYDQFLEKANNDLSKYKDGIVEAYGYLGFYYFQKKEFGPSKEYCNKVIAIDSKDKRALTLLKYYSDLEKKKAAGSK
jgi:tetratricopeptide (TPR) repeat protein